MYETNLKEAFDRARAGDREAFAQIYRAMGQPVFTVVCRIVQSKELAEDVTQDIFVKLFLSPPEPSVKNLRAWIFQMARNAAIDALRKQQRTASEDTEPVARDEIGRALLRMELASAISALTSGEREILALRINAGLPFHEVASVVGLSVPAVYRKYRKAIKTLRQRLDGGNL